MFGPLQARPSFFHEHLSQAPRPHGHSLPCTAPGVTPHEAVRLVDEAFRVPPYRTSYLPNQGVAQLLSHPFNMEKPTFSPEWSQDGCDLLSRNGHDGHIPGRLGRGLRGQTGLRNLDRRVSLLAHKLPVFLALIHLLSSLKGCHVIVRMDKMAEVSHINNGSWYHTLNRHARHLLESDSYSRSFEPRSRLSVETEGQVGEWMLNHQTVAQIWYLFSRAKVDLFAHTSETNAQKALFHVLLCLNSQNSEFVLCI